MASFSGAGPSLEESEVKGQLVTTLLKESQREPLQLYIRRFETRPVSGLHWHRSWLKNEIPTPPTGARTNADTVEVTKAGTVVGGFGAFADALDLRRKDLNCLVIDMEEEGALPWILKNSGSGTCLNKFCRVSLALDYEPYLRETGRQNQRRGGRNNGLAMLPKESAVDCREALARLASVGGRTVSKVRHLIEAAPVEVICSLRANAVTIERAFRWISVEESQRDSFAAYMVGQDVRRSIARLRRQGQKGKPARIARAKFSHLARCMTELATAGDSPIMTLDSESLCGLGDILAGLPASDR